MKPNLTNHYTEPYKLDTTMPTGGVGRVVKSNADGFKEGDLVTGFMNLAKFTNINAKNV